MFFAQADEAGVYKMMAAMGPFAGFLDFSISIAGVSFETNWYLLGLFAKSSVSSSK